MISTISACRNNESIANDYYKSRLNNTEYVRSQKQFYAKKQSAANATIERNIRKYESRRNVCDVCFTARSVATNECMCD